MTYHGCIFTEVDYVLKVKTGDIFGAGTDANVYVTMTGENGDTGERKLQDADNINKFERAQVFCITATVLGLMQMIFDNIQSRWMGAITIFFLQVDTFKLSAVDLGKLKKFKIWHDNKGGGGAWFLDYIEVMAHLCAFLLLTT